VSGQGTDRELATFQAGWRGEGEVRAAEGRKYRWHKVAFWRAAWLFTGEDDLPLVRFEREFLHRAATVMIERRTARCRI
jgi:hypothetical protein